jgi:hypothetical protein
MDGIHQRIVERRALLDRLAEELEQCRRTMEADRIRQRLLAKKYNSVIGSFGYLLEDEKNAVS